MQSLSSIDCRGKGYEGLTDASIKDRYIIGQGLSHGSFGKIMTIQDMANPEKPLVIKLQENNQVLTSEIESLVKINGIINLNHGKLIRDSNQIGIPNVIDYGILIFHNFEKSSPKAVGYYIMPRYEKTLYEHLSLFQGREYQRQVIEVALQLVSIFKIAHTSHRTYNDLKPANVLISNTSDQGKPTVHLVDYGFADKFVKENSKEHMDEDQATDTFMGNIEYSSLRQMNFLKTSRKDDLISLFYMITSLLNHNKIIKSGTDELIGIKTDQTIKQYFLQTKIHKQENGLIRLVRTLQDSDELRDQNAFYDNLAQVATIIDSMSSKDKPEYSKIRGLLKNCLA